MAIEFYKGMSVNIDEECHGVVTEVTDDRIYIESDCFRGWATKLEIQAATEWLAKERQYPRTPPLRPSSAA
jgi:hypothetical protein